MRFEYHKSDKKTVLIIDYFTILLWVLLELKMMVKAFLRNYLSITKNKTIKNVLICPDKFKFSLTAEELSKVIS